MNDYITMKNLCEELGIHESVLKYHADKRRIQRPEKIFNRLVYQQAVAQSIRDYFGSRRMYEHASKSA